jgi:hypothetical protein
MLTCWPSPPSARCLASTVRHDRRLFISLAASLVGLDQISAQALHRRRSRTARRHRDRCWCNSACCRRQGDVRRVVRAASLTRKTNRPGPYITAR